MAAAKVFGRAGAALVVLVALTSCGHKPAAKPPDGPSLPGLSVSAAPTDPSVGATAEAGDSSLTPGSPVPGHPGSTPTSGPASNQSSRPGSGPGQTSKPAGPGTPANACGAPPTGRAPDGRAQQRIVFPSPGAHQWPDTQVTMHACATSGLPVTYQFENGGRGGSCRVSDPVGTTYGSQGVPISCQVTATQAGNAAFAPAAPVTGTWAVNKMVITYGVLGSAEYLTYSAANPKATIQVRLTAIHDIPQVEMSTQATGACSPPNSMRVGGTGGRDIIVNVEITLTAQGDCDINVSVHVNQVIDVDPVIGASRHYTVKR
ncbi:hypothetical protein [Amycolatopsis sp. lyj-109]|uniref:hypothetical protein n=1 Tax=Amycolatopsis sp. lyj-109 TaxID=2789287 RepID=UPI00397988DC